MSQLRKTRWHEASCTLGHPMKTTAETPMTESTATMASPAMMVPKMTATTVAAAMMMVMSVRFP
jgi:hypothetical protein